MVWIGSRLYIRDKPNQFVRQDMAGKKAYAIDTDLSLFPRILFH